MRIIRFTVIAHVVFFTTRSAVEAFHAPAPVVETLIGAVAGGVGAFAVYPIDYVKTQLQTEAGSEKYASGGADAFSTIVRDEGFATLYRGVGVQVLGVAPEKAIKLTVNDFARAVLLGSGVGGGLLPWCPPVVGEIVAGGVAGACQVVVTNPLEVVKITLQTRTDVRGENVLDEIGGLKGLYRGAGICAVRDVTFSAILFSLYSHAKEFVPHVLANAAAGHHDVGGGDALPWPVILCLSGMLASAPAAYLSTPFDVVKTRRSMIADEIRKTSIMTSGVVGPGYLETIGSTNFATDGNRSWSVPSSKLVASAAMAQSVLGSPVVATAPSSSVVGNDWTKDNHRRRPRPRSSSSSSTPFAGEKSSLEIASDMLSESGLQIFFSGGIERVLRSSPQFGVTLALFDVLKRAAEQHGFL